jgi:hypothetical protein
VVLNVVIAKLHSYVEGSNGIDHLLNLILAKLLVSRVQLDLTDEHLNDLKSLESLARVDVILIHNVLDLLASDGCLQTD